jgi:hypothetical protein
LIKKFILVCSRSFGGIDDWMGSATQTIARKRDITLPEAEYEPSLSYMGDEFDAAILMSRSRMGLDESRISEIEHARKSENRPSAIINGFPDRLSVSVEGFGSRMSPTGFEVDTDLLGMDMITSDIINDLEPVDPRLLSQEFAQNEIDHPQPITFGIEEDLRPIEEPLFEIKDLDEKK